MSDFWANRYWNGTYWAERYWGPPPEEGAVYADASAIITASSAIIATAQAVVRPPASPIIYLGAGWSDEKRDAASGVKQATKLARKATPSPAIANALSKAIRLRNDEARVEAIEKAMGQLSHVEKKAAAFVRLQEALQAYEIEQQKIQDEEEAMILAMVA